MLAVLEAKIDIPHRNAISCLLAVLKAKIGLSRRNSIFCMLAVLKAKIDISLRNRLLKSRYIYSQLIIDIVLYSFVYVLLHL